MKRTIEILPDTEGPVIHSTNGVDTRTAPVYLKKLKDYRPEPNGFVAELADDILEKVRRYPLLWDQGSWRNVITVDPHEDPEFYAEMTSLLNTPVPQGEPACGTTMCIAGWGAELSGADLMIDADSLGRLSAGEELVLVAPTQWEAMAPCDVSPVLLSERAVWLDNQLQQVLTERGFTGNHYVVSISAYASAALGLVHGDWLDLFSGDHDLETIEEIIALYARYGVVPSEEALQERYPERVKEARREGYSVLDWFGFGHHQRDCRRAMAPA